jgi:GT2 family glycosyltransferase
MPNADLIIPTKDQGHSKISAMYLIHYPFQGKRIYVRDGKNWPTAINIGLKQSDPAADVVLMDDDIFLTPESFGYLPAYYDQADIFGFKLLFPDGRLQHAGGVFSAGTVGHRFFCCPDNGIADKPLFLAHVTTSLIYIKRHVLDKLGGMAEDYPGTQMEDVDFCLRAIKAGFKIMYLPSPAVHLESATKKTHPMFRIGMAQNMLELRQRHFADAAFYNSLETYPKEVPA